jgi:hypothetical protein
MKILSKKTDDMDSSVRVIVVAVIVAALAGISPKPAEARCLVNCSYDGETYVGYDGYVRAYYGRYYGGYYGGYPPSYFGGSRVACPVYITQRYVRGCYRY